MPHLTVEYSANLEPRLDVGGLLHAVHEAAMATKIAEVGGFRTRAERREHFVVADGDPRNGFVAIRVRIARGRDAATRATFAEAVFEAATAYLEPLFASVPLAISLEVAEIDPVGSLKRNNLHERMRARATVSV
jgi:5-carboxymethyl-2-hydroxymuconate isomerase